MIELEVKNLEKYYGANLIFKDINFDVKTKERVAIVGRNGCGKSTVFKILSNKENKDGGEVLIKKGSKIAYLEQIPYFKNCTVKDVLNLSFPEVFQIEENLRMLEKKMQENSENINSILEKYSKLQGEYERLGGYEKDTFISKICTGLNMSEKFLELDFDTLSGGEKTRVMLGKILLENPDILLLDEPTNHLDMSSVEWLEEYLNNYEGSVIIISHDRYFLDKVVNKVVEIENLVSKTYKGNYSSFESQKEENFILQQHVYKEQQKKIHAMEESIKQLKVFSRNGENENFFKRAVSMQRRLDKMEKIDRPNDKKDNMKINIINNSKQSKDVILIEEGSKYIDKKLLFKDVNLLIERGENVALIGANGCGKSTLVKIILGEDRLDSGVLKISKNSKIGYLPQQVVFEDEEKTILEWFREDINILEGKAREYLSRYMFYSEDVFKKVKSLSGGEKSRLKLSKILYFEVNLLILDEPTNHLDIESIKQLEAILSDFKGSIFFVSHDRYFINNISHRVLSMENKIIYSWEGNYDYYKEKHVILEGKLEKQDENKSVSMKKSKSKNSTEKESRSKMGIDRLEKEIEVLELKLENLDIQIEEVNSDYNKLQDLYEEKIKVESKLNELMEVWIGEKE